MRLLDLLREVARYGHPLTVLDLELTAWEGSLASNWSRPGEHPEVVQIGSVRLGRGLVEIGSFSTYVRPVLNPVLSDYFVELTGITQEVVDSTGVRFDSAIDRLAEVSRGSLAIVCNGTDGDAIFRNCLLHGLTCPFEKEIFRNIREDLASALSKNEHEVDSYKLPEIISRQMQASAHDALSDARCVAEALRFIASDVIC